MTVDLSYQSVIVIVGTKAISGRVIVGVAPTIVAQVVLTTEAPRDVALALGALERLALARAALAEHFNDSLVFLVCHAD